MTSFSSGPLDFQLPLTRLSGKLGGMNDKRNPTALFVADSHFHLRPDPAEQERVAAFLDFLAMAGRVDHLFLLGDIFDFWFDYPHFRLKGYEAILQGLDRVRDQGTRIHFVGGNHDIWAINYFHARFDCPREAGPRTLDLGGTRIHLCHGDGLFCRDWFYRTFRSLVRTKGGIVLAKSLHPEMLYALSVLLSDNSRKGRRDEAERIETKARTWLSQQTHTDWDLMVIGHLHHAFDIRVGSSRLAALAGWLDSCGYGLLKQGEFHLLDYQRDPRPNL